MCKSMCKFQLILVQKVSHFTPNFVTFCPILSHFVTQIAFFLMLLDQNQKKILGFLTTKLL